MALLRPKPGKTEPGRRALTAATATVSLTADSSWKTWKFGNTDWQAEAWRLYGVVGELHFLAGRTGDSISQCHLYVAEVDETGEEVGKVEDPQIQRLAAIPLGTGAQRDGSLKLAGADLTVGGECWIVGEGAARDPLKAEGQWYVVTGAALKNNSGEISVRRPKHRGGGWLKLQDKRDILTRCWEPHPNDIDQADSPTRPGIVPLREIELLTKREFAELDSRLTGAGIMFLPEGIDFPREPDAPAGVAGFMELLQKTAAASIRDQSTAAALVPIMATVPTEALQYLDQARLINFWSELSAEVGPMKERAIKRLASFYELPAEVLEGIGNANHWTAWLISEEGIRWIRRYLGLIADALTRGFLALALTKVGVENPERYAFRFDTAPLAARPNRLDDALRLHDKHLISDEEAVLAGAFSTEQMPDAEELLRQRTWALVQTQPDLILDPAVQRVLGFPEIQSVGLPPTADQNADSEPVSGRNEPPNRGAAPDAPDREEADALTAALGARIAALAAEPAPQPQAILNASAKLLIFRALELAGGRLATPAERRGRWREVPRHELHARIGPITPERAERVTEGAWNHVPLVAADLGVDPDALHRLLSGYVQQLLVLGRPHDDDLLFDALSIANRGRGLIVGQVAA